MKLQLYQQTIRNGENHQAVYNGSDASQGILDIRIGSLFALPSTFNEVLHALAFGEHGYYLYVIKPLSSRIGDYKALIVYVPQQIARSVISDIGQIVSSMSDLLKNGGEVTHLAHYFEKAYKQEDLHFGQVRKTNRYACRCYGNDRPCKNLDEVFDRSVLQLDYMRYEGVFFLSPSQEKMTRDGVMEDITMKPMRPARWSLWLTKDDDTPSPMSSSMMKKDQDKRSKKKKIRLSPKFVAGLVAGLLLGGMAGWTAKSLLTKETPSPEGHTPIIVADSTTIEWEDTLVADTMPIDTFFTEYADPQ